MVTNNLAKTFTDIELKRIDNIHLVQSALEALPKEFKLDCASYVKHHFAPGVYAREMFLPRGMLVAGKIHKHSHVNIISYGHVIVHTFEGTEEYIGHHVLVSPAGCKRVVLALQPTKWTTIHLTDKTDLIEIEKEIIAEDYSEVI